ncbi:UPF0270 [Desulfonema magnum]|uniref:UPF0270 n=1 Tax=Desulfonema magnum TaxID=45655 RepID=A0A975BJB6_9BACT|nr:UPF0270 [Desulfonema magnum]
MGKKKMSNLVIIPYDQLTPEALQGLIEEFVTREGTEYGDRTFSLEEKVAQVRSQLKSGKALITYDERNQTCNIVSEKQMKIST